MLRNTYESCSVSNVPFIKTNLKLVSQCSALIKRSHTIIIYNFPETVRFNFTLSLSNYGSGTYHVRLSGAATCVRICGGVDAIAPFCAFSFCSRKADLYRF
uniref:(northern house mosquito) hypothetical protein n=1 Tax=Culex pipiens TaxID=7175 RepID=A0A8D8L7F3_CULPI